eukprot:TRINITY_DN1682_c0_g1_i5.p1 TRINITY_DN1682_c0_g1~~TRINITY_DN1682_c0_g1_i5.p1  ORF type:complete len:116 (-),score=32.89 TRINITY_DN1682_c0_g1_i5:84-431(-)
MQRKPAAANNSLSFPEFVLQGPCQDHPPYFGIVKRSMNRAPSPRDFWWEQHQLTCGGTYTKIKSPEPKKPDPKNKSASSSNRVSKKKRKQVKDEVEFDIKSFFSKKEDDNSNSKR